MIIKLPCIKKKPVNVEEALERSEKIKAYALLYLPSEGTSRSEETRLFLLAAYTLEGAMEIISREFPGMSRYRMKKYVVLPLDELFPGTECLIKTSDRSEVEAPEVRLMRFENYIRLLLDEADPTKTEQKAVVGLIKKLKNKYVKK